MVLLHGMSRQKEKELRMPFMQSFTGCIHPQNVVSYQKMEVYLCSATIAVPCIPPMPVSVPAAAAPVSIIPARAHPLRWFSLIQPPLSSLLFRLLFMNLFRRPSVNPFRCLFTHLSRPLFMILFSPL